MIGFYHAWMGTWRPGHLLGLLALVMLSTTLAFASAPPEDPSETNSDAGDSGEPAAETAEIDPALIVRLPIEIINNRVHVTLTVDGSPVKMLLDTGASTTVLFKNPGLSDQAIKAGEAVDINFPAFRTATTGYRLPNVIFEAGDFSFRSNSTLFIGSRDQISTDLSMQIEGILGRDFFNAYVVEIIPSEKAMALLDTAAGLDGRFRYRHKLYLDGGSPYLLHRSRLPWEHHPTHKKLLLDTGYPGGIVLWDDRHFERATNPDEREQLKRENKGVLYYGLIKFGRLLFKNIPIFIGPNAPEKTHDREGIIGASMFLPFRYAIDLKGNTLWLNPRVRSFGHGYQIRNDVIYTPGNEGFVVKDFPAKISATPTVVLKRDTEVVPD